MNKKVKNKDDELRMAQSFAGAKLARDLKNIGLVYPQGIHLDKTLQHAEKI